MFARSMARQFAPAGIHASQNYWGGAAGPGGEDCTTASGTDISFTPALRKPVREDDDDRDER
jgi:hypothetical protein